MKTGWLPVLCCPVCRGSLTADTTRVAEGELVEGFLVCRACLEVRLVAGGSAFLSLDLRAHLREQGSVYRRTTLADPRVVRFVLGQAGSGVDVVPFDEVTARYGDLVVEPEQRRPPDPLDRGLDRLLERVLRRPECSRALELGTGVGRGAFVLAAHGWDTVGVDRSAARVRRARNLAATEDGFTLPALDDPRREVALDLGALARAGVDFAVADAGALPFADAAFGFAVQRGGDGLGPWPDPAAMGGELRRVLAPGARVAEPSDLAAPFALPGETLFEGEGWRLVAAA